MAMFGSSKLQFLFVCEQKQLARVLPESSAVICAELVDLAQALWLLLRSTLKSFLRHFSQKVALFFSL